MKDFVNVRHIVVMRSRERLCFLAKKFLEKPDLLNPKRLGVKIPIEVFEYLMRGGQEIPSSKISEMKEKYNLPEALVDELLSLPQLPETHPYCGYTEPDYDTRPGEFDLKFDFTDCDYWCTCRGDDNGCRLVIKDKFVFIK